MINREIDAYCVQETWLTGNWEKIINGYLFIHHGIAKETCKRGCRGVGIFLSPHMQKCYERVEKGNREQSSDDGNSVDEGRFLSIKVELNSTFRLIDGAFRRRKKRVKKVQTRIKLCSIYMPVEKIIMKTCWILLILSLLMTLHQVNSKQSLDKTAMHKLARV